MSYTTGENLMATVVKAHANFDATNVAQAKWTMLDKGKSDHYAILKHGGMDPEFISPTVWIEKNITVIEVWQRYKNDGSTATSLYGYVANVISQIQNNEKLGDTGGVIQNAQVGGVGEVMEMWRKGGGPAWLKQEVFVTWQEQTKSS